jgi:hypothetical protein
VGAAVTAADQEHPQHDPEHGEARAHQERGLEPLREGGGNRRAALREDVLGAGVRHRGEHREAERTADLL